jgi:hypothetical protein
MEMIDSLHKQRFVQQVSNSPRAHASLIARSQNPPSSSGAGSGCLNAAAIPGSSGASGWKHTLAAKEQEAVGRWQDATQLHTMPAPP